MKNDKISLKAICKRCAFNQLIDEQTSFEILVFIIKFFEKMYQL